MSPVSRVKVKQPNARKSSFAPMASSPTSARIRESVLKPACSTRFHYRRFSAGANAGRCVRRRRADRPKRRRSTRVGDRNVIDSRQITAGAAQPGSAARGIRERPRTDSLSYEMVALSHATARELGYRPPRTAREARKPFVEVSGRKASARQDRRSARLLVEKAAAEVANGTRISQKMNAASPRRLPSRRSVISC